MGTECGHTQNFAVVFAASGTVCAWQKLYKNIMA